MKRWLLAVLLGGLSCAHQPSYAPQPGNPYVRVVLHVPPDRKDEALRDAQLAKVALEKHGMHLLVHAVEEIGEIDTLDRSTRKSLTAKEDPAFIHAYYVNTIPKEDPGDGDGKLLGLQWERGRKVVFAVSKKAQPTTFAHELGHALGLSHVEGEDPENAMCICTRNNTAGYTKAQARVMLGYEE